MSNQNKGNCQQGTALRAYPCQQHQKRLDELIKVMRKYKVYFLLMEHTDQFQQEALNQGVTYDRINDHTARIQGWKDPRGELCQ